MNHALVEIMALLYKRKRRRKRPTWYRHECEPVVQMFNAVDRVVA